MAGYSRVTCVGCSNFKPYYIKKGTAIASFGDVVEDGLELGDDVRDGVIIALNVARINLDFDTKLKVQNQKVANVKRVTAELTSLTISLFPGVGEAYDIATLIAGKDPITQEALNPFTRFLTIIGLVSGLGSGPMARFAGMEALQAIARKFALTDDEVFKIAADVISQYKINSIQDIIDNKAKLNLNSFKLVVENEVKIYKAVKSIKWSIVPKPDLSKIENEYLKSSLANDYRLGATVGNGSTADAIRYTKATGILVGGSDHIEKGQGILNSIQKRFNANDLNEYDKKIATDIFNDITNALNGN